MTRPDGGRWPWWRRISIACAAAATVPLACGPGPQSAPPTSHAASPTPQPAVSVAPLSEWQKRGATEVPPAELQAVSLNGIQVIDQTGGGLGDAESRAWAAAFLRAINYEYWAVSRQQDRFLMQSGLSSAPLAVFRPDLADIGAARKTSSRIDYVRKVFRRLVLRSVPDTMRTTFTRQLVVWKPYAFYLDAVGPSAKRVTDQAGHQTTQTLYQPGEPAFELVGGELMHDPLMGDVFAFASDWDCVDPANRRNLAPLCNP